MPQAIISFLVAQLTTLVLLHSWYKLAIKITLTNLTFSEIRYNTYGDWGYDDTHVDNIRMTKVTASFSYEVSQEVI